MLVNGKQSELISIRDRGLLYGDGVFRTILVQSGRAFHWPLHYQKLQNDCAALGIQCPGFSILSTELNDILLKNSDVGVIKLIVTRGIGGRGYSPKVNSDPTYIWDISPMPSHRQTILNDGIKAIFCDIRIGKQPFLAGIKHLNRLENVLAAAELIKTGADEGLLVDFDGNVIEGTRSNLFIFQNGKLVTPELSQCGVAGVQRDRVINWAIQNNVQIEVRNIMRNEVLAADELFVVNSIIKIWPIGQLDQRKWKDFPVTSRISIGLDRQDG